MPNKIWIKLFDTLMMLMKKFFETINFEKKNQLMTKEHSKSKEPLSSIVKTVLVGRSKVDKTKILMTNV